MNISLLSNTERTIILTLVIIFLLILIYRVFKKRYCPKCKTLLPIFRRPKNNRQILMGGWTCPKCKAELTAYGKLVNLQASRNKKHK